MNKTNNVVDVLLATHGAQAGAQANYDPSTHTWTVWDKYDILHHFVNIREYVTFMTGGVA